MIVLLLQHDKNHTAIQTTLTLRDYDFINNENSSRWGGEAKWSHEDPNPPTSRTIQDLLRPSVVRQFSPESGSGLVLVIRLIATNQSKHSGHRDRAVHLN